MPTSIRWKSHVIPHEGAYKLGPMLLFRCGLYLLVYLRNPIVSPEGALTNRGQCYCSDVAYGYQYTIKIPWYLPWRRLMIVACATVQMWLLRTSIHSKSHVISHESDYTIGSVLLFRCGLCLPLYLQNSMLSLIKAITHKGQCYCSDVASAYHYTFKIPCYLSLKRLHIRVSVTVQMWPLPTI